MKNPIQKLYEDLQEELILYAEMGTPPVNKLGGALQSLRAAMTKLKKYIIEHPFNNETAEICFFKEEKPKFVSEQIYVLEFTAIQTGKPAYDEAMVREYCSGEMKRVRDFFGKYGFLYQYYQLGAIDLDRVLFLRAAGPTGMLMPQPPDPDPEFSTNCDFLFAKFIAYERLQEWLIAEIKSFDRPVKQLFDVSGCGKRGEATLDNEENGLKWTGETINLTEIAYGIWLTGQVNNGNASVTEIVAFLERVFSVKIGSAHRRWQSISRRKRIASFKYIDEVKAALEKRLEEEFGK